MAIDSWSKFYYVDSVTRSNQNLNFDEGSGELQAIIDVASYTLDELPLAIKTAMDAVGTQEYTVTLDRATRVFTISASGSFDLLIDTGTQAGTSIFSVIGFTGADLTGLTTYSGNAQSGTSYGVQFKLQDYVAPDFSQQRIQPAVNESASGKIEVVSFGIRKFIEMNLMFITNSVMDGKVIRNNASGVEDALSFLEFATTKAPLEFIEDDLDSDTFYKVILESAPGSSDGTGFILKEETGNNLRDIYKTGLLKWRIV